MYYIENISYLELVWSIVYSKYKMLHTWNYYIVTEPSGNSGQGRGRKDPWRTKRPTMIVPCRHRSSNPQRYRQWSDAPTGQDQASCASTILVRYCCHVPCQQVIPYFFVVLLFAAAVDELEVSVLVEGTMHICHPSTSKSRPDFGPLGQVGQYSGMFVQSFETRLYLLFAKYFVAYIEVVLFL